MNNLDYFKKFVPAKETVTIVNLEVWSYTRVSSKEQSDTNSSLQRQMEANKEFAQKINLNIVEHFGGTYESAKSDFTRKEFSRLIEKVKRSRKKPHAILVYKMSRFSRSGGNAIGLVSYLVDELKVHLYEVSSGLNTTTERGKAAIWDSLFSAYKENLERKEIIIPNMIAAVKSGAWFSRAPLGYDHFGPRVKDIKFFNPVQKIVINADGMILKEAWQWKKSGLFSDVQIIQKLANRGLIIDPKKLSKIWRNPFYCGIGTNKLGGGPVKGKWEALISIDDFMQVQKLLEKNTSGYQHKKEVDNRPLTRLLKCNDCGSYMVGYVNKQKQLHYYRCIKCNGVSLNAHSTPKALKKSAHALFIELLNEYQIPKKIIPLIELQLKKLFEHYQTGNGSNDEHLERQLSSLESDMKQLKLRFGLGKIDKDTFDITFEHLDSQIKQIRKELNTDTVKISNLNSLLNKSLKKLENISKIWGSSELEEKRALHKCLFPDGIYYDAKNHQYLTREVNKFLELTNCISIGLEGTKNGISQSQVEKSHLVARSRLELPTFGL